MKAFLLTAMSVWFLLGCNKAGAPSSNLDTHETYVQLWPADGFLYIKDYYVSSKENDPNTIRKQVSLLTKLVRDARYCKTRYGLELFSPMEERVFHDRDFVTIESRLLTKERNVIKQIENVFSSILNRKVVVKVSDQDVGLYFDGPDVSIRDNNSKGVFANGDHRAIFWENGQKFYEIVLADTEWNAAAPKSIAPYLEEDVASPEKSPAEIKAWKEAK
jgi:hypothetical protein